MASAAPASWQFTGDYFENCNCDLICPCLFSAQPQLTSQPTAGVCDVAIGIHIERGSFGDVAAPASPQVSGGGWFRRAQPVPTPASTGVTLDGLNAAVMAHTPGPMGAGNWTVAVYLDERANERRRQALQAIFSGAAGGIVSNLAPLIGTMLGVKFVPITFQKDGLRRSLEIPGIAHLAVRALPGPTPDKEMWAVGASPFNPEGVSFAAGEQGSTWQDYGMRWDNSGKNAHYAAITWTSAA
jgi:hypothetical protein